MKKKTEMTVCRQQVPACLLHMLGTLNFSNVLSNL